MSIDFPSFPASLAEIRRAAEYLAPVAVRTPPLESPNLNDNAGRRVPIKAEVLQRTGSLIRPYDDALVIAGQGTVGLEIAEQATAAGVAEADVLVCCGGGGLTSGIAIALHSVAPGLRVRPVEPVAAGDTRRSLIAGVRLANEGNPESFCDAIVTPMPGELTFPVLQQLAGPVLTVDDRAVLVAMGQALMRLKLVVEPGGAVALAAALNADSVDGDAVICVATCGNVDPQLISAAAATFVP